MLLLTSSCASISRSAIGLWAGSCVLEGGQYAAVEQVDFELGVDEDDGGEVEGEGWFVYAGDTFTGPIRGSRHTSAVELWVDGASGGHATRLELYGELQGDTLTGSCWFYGLEGALEMRR